MYDIKRILVYFSGDRILITTVEGEEGLRRKGGEGVINICSRM